MEVVCTLADILAEKGMSRRQLAKEAGIAPNTVGNLARAHYSSTPIVSLGTLAKVCAVLDLVPGDMLRKVGCYPYKSRGDIPLRGPD